MNKFYKYMSSSANRKEYVHLADGRLKTSISDFDTDGCLSVYTGQVEGVVPDNYQEISEEEFKSVFDKFEMPFKKQEYQVYDYGF